jgi:hypothetical protein
MLQVLEDGLLAYRLLDFLLRPDIERISIETFYFH